VVLAVLSIWLNHIRVSVDILHPVVDIGIIAQNKEKNVTQILCILRHIAYDFNRNSNIYYDTNAALLARSPRMRR
jgi:hypothetical protein